MSAHGRMTMIYKWPALVSSSAIFIESIVSWQGKGNGDYSGKASWRKG